MKQKKLIQVNTPYGKLPVSLKKCCFHDGVPSTPIIIDWFHAVEDYGVENGWEFSLDCLGEWLKEEYPHNYQTIQIIVKNYKENINES